MKDAKRKHWTWSKESRQKASLANKKVWQRLGYREKMSQLHKENPTKYWLGKKRTGQGIGLWMKGKKMPEKVKEKIRKFNIKNQTRKRFPHLPKRWKGTKRKYLDLHLWINKILGKPQRCERCKLSGFVGKKIHWANKSGQYKREIKDWIRLCAKCHFRYDLRK